MIDLRRVRALREVAERGTIARAADALQLTPSAVSQQLAALEREVGQPLLEPHGRSVRLTPAARVLLAHGEALFAQLELLRSDLEALAGGEAGHVAIGGFATALRSLVVPAVERLRAVRPGLAIAVREAEAPESFTALARHELDVVVAMEALGVPQEDDTRFARRALLADVLDAALPVGHRLAGAGEVALAELAGETWIAPPAGWSCEHVVLTGCAAAGFTPRVEHRSGDWDAVLAMVAAGFGVALLPRLARAVPPPGVVVRPLAGEPPCRHVFAACRRGAEHGPATAAVLEALAEAAERQRAWAGAGPAAAQAARPRGASEG
jgi:DNA-binding transcriptional LysR family regulator